MINIDMKGNKSLKILLEEKGIYLTDKSNGNGDRMLIKDGFEIGFYNHRKAWDELIYGNKDEPMDSVISNLK